MTFNIPELADGIGFVVIAMGVFGFAEIMRNLENDAEPRHRAGQDHRPDADAQGPEGCRAGAIGRGTLLGSILGILPGGGAVIAAFAAYTLEKKIAKDPSRFGTRRDRRRGRAGKRQQCRRADLVHSAAHARHSAERR